ncbi:CGNR zinc finger domain-containing protein [Gemmatimonas aurantiaca]|uniref:CGNR zinc finger domain-containing protein n=1 Tax=Gemmatimonas aurantiaca TaxID=173480 RepID=UPI00301D2BFF
MAVVLPDARVVAARERPPGSLPPRTRLWLDFVNTDAAGQSPGGDLLRDFEALLTWLQQHAAVDDERAGGILRRAVLQPAAAAATLVDARRVRAALRALAERGEQQARVRDDAVVEINRVLGRSAGTRRIDPRSDGGYTRSFVPTGDAFAGLMIPIVESAAESLVEEELGRVRRCADPRCHRVFLDATKNGLRRWCDMGTCGNRAKAARHRARAAGAM